MPRRAFLILVALLTLADVRGAAAPLVRDEVDWPAFLSRLDPVWEQLPQQWNEGAFAGNGRVGFVAHASLSDNRFDFRLGSMEVTDHRRAPDRATSLGVRGANLFWDFPRLDVGRVALRPTGWIQEGTSRLDLWNAQVVGKIVTSLGEFSYRALTLRDRPVHLIELTTTEKYGDGREVGWEWEFIPGYPGSPRALVRPQDAAKQNYQPNPLPRRLEVDGVQVSEHPLLAGGEFATAWLEQRSADGRSSRLFVATINGAPESGRAVRDAVAAVRAAAAESTEQLVAAHRAWWHDHYRRAFLTIPDARLESFYWIQLYKLACCLRADGPALDVMGPFYRTTQWPGIWWNLNIQLSYWPVYAGNRLALGESLTRLLDSRFNDLLATFRGGPALGDFAWALHNYWWQLRFAGDWRGVVERWAPKADAVIADYLPRLKKNAAGQLELGPMGSPEYRGFAPFQHTSYNLALLRWLLNARLQADAHTGRPADPRAAEWRRVLAELAPFPTDATGLRIAANQGLDESHRHFSHLLALYPLFQLDPDSPADRDLVVRSVEHWHRLDHGKALAGYSFTGGAALYAALGRGDDALAMLQTFLDGRIGISQLHANTFYTESGGKNPVIETPLSGASATMDLLLQSWGDKLRVFPAVPTRWAAVSFRDLRGVGGFLVSAERANGRTAWVHIRSEAGEPCVVKVADWDGPLHVAASRPITVTPLGAGEYRLDLRAGEEALLSPAANPVTTAAVRALPAPADEANPYGVKIGGELQSDQNWPEPPPAFAPPR
jgi:hypothetical protein